MTSRASSRMHSIRGREPRPKPDVPVKIDIKENLDSLFALDAKIAKANPFYLPPGTTKKFLDFLTVEHKSEIWTSRDAHGRLVGYISIVDKPSEDVMEILALGIDPDFQKKGYGKRMVNFAERRAIRNGRRKIMLVANEKNASAIRFYERLGYAAIKKMPDYYCDGETRILFEKVLD